jgi:cell division protein ZipA
MDIGLKEWLIIGGILVIGLIIFDGWRRKRGQRDTLKINIDGSLSDVSEDDHNPELPNGGARVKKHDETGHDYLGFSASDETANEEVVQTKSSFDSYKSGRSSNSGRETMRARRVVLPEETEPNESYPAPSETKRSEPRFEEPLEPEYDSQPVLSEQVSESSIETAVEPSFSAVEDESAISVDDIERDTAQDSIRVDTGFESEQPTFTAYEAESEPEPIEQAEEETVHVHAELDVPEPAPVSFSAVDEPIEPEPEIVEAVRDEPALEPKVSASARPIHELDPLFDDIPDEPLEETHMVETEREAMSSAEFSATVDTSSHATSLSSDFEPVLSEEQPAPSASKDTVDFDQPITVLMRQVSENAAKRGQVARKSPQKLEPEEDERLQQEMFDWHLDDDDSEDAMTLRDQAQESLKVELETVEVKPKKKVKKKKAKEKVAVQEDIPEQDSLFHDPLVEEAKTTHRARQHVPDPEEVLVITVVGNDHPLNGRTLLEVVVACGMRHGDMSLFHRFEDGLEKGAVQFSMANAVNPGTFDLDTMSDMETKGVSFFMSMSEPKDPKTAFDCMLATAETVAKHLNGDLLDENHSVMRPQTKMHYKERIREYELHKRARQGRADMA